MHRPDFKLFIPIISLVLTGCGFHLRNHLVLPNNTQVVHVQSSTPFSPLVIQLQRNLSDSNISVVTDDTASTTSTPPSQLSIISERWGELPIAIDAHGRVQEFSLRYATVFSLTDPQGKVLIPQQVIELSRDYVSPPVDAIGTNTERETLTKELYREMASSILRRIDSEARRAHNIPSDLHIPSNPSHPAGASAPIPVPQPPPAN